jgi:hypothetical protein
VKELWSKSRFCWEMRNGSRIILIFWRMFEHFTSVACEFSQPLFFTPPKSTSMEVMLIFSHCVRIVQIFTFWNVPIENNCWLLKNWYFRHQFWFQEKLENPLFWPLALGPRILSRETKENIRENGHCTHYLCIKLLFWPWV